MNAHRFALTAATLALIAGAAVSAQPATQERPGQQDKDTMKQQRPATAQPARPDAMATATVLIPSAWAIGANVLGADGDEIGEINDLVMDTRGAKVTHALVSHGDVLGVGGKLVALPWKTLKWNASDRNFTVALTEQQLDNAPDIDKDRIGDARTAQGDRRYGLVNVRDDRAQRNAWNSGGEYQNLVAGGRDTTVRGTVNSIDRAEPMQGMQEGIVITLADNGAEHTVHLGPAWFIDRQDVMLRLNDQIEIKGVQVDLRGDNVIVCKTLTSPHGEFKLRDEQNKPVWDASAGGGAATPQDSTRPRTRQVNQPLDQNRPANQPDAINRPNQPDKPDAMKRDKDAAHFTGPVDQQALGAADQTMLVSEVQGQTLRTAGENDLGDIEAVVFDAMTGKVAFVAVGVGGFLGLGETHVALPWSMVRREADDRLMVSVDRAAIEKAPRLEGDDWEELSDRTFTTRIYQHFGQPSPFDGARGPMGPDVQGQRPFQPGTDRPQVANQYIKLFTDGQPTEITGTVRTVSQAQPGGMTEPIMVIFIEQQGGERRTVHIAPRTFLETGNFTVEQGNNVTVNGRLATIDGEQVVIASRLQKDGRTLELRGDDGVARWGAQGR